MIDEFLEYLRHHKNFTWRELFDRLEKMNMLFGSNDYVYWLAAPDKRKILFHEC